MLQPFLPCWGLCRHRKRRNLVSCNGILLSIPKLAKNSILPQGLVPAVLWGHDDNPDPTADAGKKQQPEWEHKAAFLARKGHRRSKRPAVSLSVSVTGRTQVGEGEKERLPLPWGRHACPQWCSPPGDPTALDSKHAHSLRRSLD